MKKFIKGFAYAGVGIWSVLEERNMRIHLCFTVYMFAYLTIYDFFDVTGTQIAILVALCALVLSLECVNTAVESVVDLVTSEKHPLAKRAKDAAAGAVLISAVASVIAGVVILYQPDAFRKMFRYYCDNPIMIVILALSLALSLWFVFGFKSKQNKNKGN